jgi:hypothetical protein
VASPASTAAPGFTSEARRRIALFLLVLVLAGGAAWGAGRVLSTTMVTVDPHQGHDMTDMPGMDH